MRKRGQTLAKPCELTSAKASTYIRKRQSLCRAREEHFPKAAADFDRAISLNGLESN